MLIVTSKKLQDYELKNSFLRKVVERTCEEKNNEIGKNCLKLLVN